MHFPSKKNKFFNAFVMCLLFGISLAFHIFASGFSGGTNVCTTTYADDKTICYVAIGGGAFALSGLLWPFLPQVMQVSIGLFGTSAWSPVTLVSIGIGFVTELIKVQKHTAANMRVPMESGMCMMEETAFTLAQLKQNLFGESDMDKMKQGIKDVQNQFNGMQDENEEFRRLIERSIGWLVKIGEQCNSSLQAVLQTQKGKLDLMAKHCRTHAERNKLWEEMKEARNETFFYEICEDTIIDLYPLREVIFTVIEAVATWGCDRFSKEKIMAAIYPILIKIKIWMDNFIRMRLGIVFELFATNNVEDELKSAFGWDDTVSSLDKGANVIQDLVNFIRYWIIPYISILFAFGWLVHYYINYLFGGLKFDNKYAPEDDADKYIDKPDNSRFLPLKFYETKKLQMVPGLIPTPDDWSKYIRAFLNWATLFIALIIFLIVSFDVGTTEAGYLIYVKSIELYNHVQGRLFEFRHDKEMVTGIQRFGQMLADKLDEIQQSAGVARIFACIQKTVPIDYDYKLIIWCIFWYVIVYQYARIKLKWLPSMIMAEYYPERHDERMEYLAKTTLAKRDHSAEVNPTFFTFFVLPTSQIFSGFAFKGFPKSFEELLPKWIQNLIKMNQTLGDGSSKV